MKMVCHMTAKPETKFWKKLKEITPEVHWTRIESFSSPGVPDLHGVFRGKDGYPISFFVELKCTKLKKIALTPRQISWNYSYNEAGGLNFIMAATLPNRALYIYSGGMARELSITGLDTEPLAIIPYPWDPGKLLQVMESFLHYRESCDIATEL